MNGRYDFMQRRGVGVLTALILAAGGVAVLPHGAAAKTTEELSRKIETMEKQIQDMKAELQATKQKAEAAQEQATKEDNPDIKWHFGGVVVANYTAVDKDGGGSTNSFGNGQFAPIFLLNYKELLQAEAHIEFTTDSDGETATSLEYANLNLFATDWLTVTAGKFLSPIGDFQLHQHPAWINKLPDRPAGFVEDGGTEPLSDVGVVLRGAVPIGSTTLDYAVFAGNGPRIADAADDGILLEGRVGDDNNDKAFGGRIGFRPLPYLNIGVSGMHSKIRGNEGTGGVVTSAPYNLGDVDAAFTMGNWDIRGEYIRAHLGGLTGSTDAASNAPQAIPATTWVAWYAQAAYRLAGITKNPILGKFEPVVRYSRFHVSGLDDFQANEEDRWSAGLAYWFAPSVVAKVAYESRDFDNKTDEDDYRVQFAFGF